MNVHDITDFETELRVLCERYEKLLPHAALVGVLGIVQHIYLDAQINNQDCAKSCAMIPSTLEPVEIKPGSLSPLPREVENG